IAAAGSGPYTASFAGLASGTHTLRAFATDAQDAPSVTTGAQSAPFIGNIASYTFTVTGGTSRWKRSDFNANGTDDILIRDLSNGTAYGWLMNGLSIASGGYLLSADSGWTPIRVADLNGDGK